MIGQQESLTFFVGITTCQHMINQDIVKDIYKTVADIVCKCGIDTETAKELEEMFEKYYCSVATHIKENQENLKNF